MREIKFRFWDSRLQRMMASQTITELMKHNHYNLDNDVMQYTGLKDNNRRDVYEGDIVSYSPNRILSLNLEVFFTDGIFGGKQLSLFSEQYTLAEILISGGEVIGNIYENPELLKNEK